MLDISVKQQKIILQQQILIIFHMLNNKLIFHAMHIMNNCDSLLFFKVSVNQRKSFVPFNLIRKNDERFMSITGGRLRVKEFSEIHEKEP